MGRGDFSLILVILLFLPTPGESCNGRTLLTEPTGFITDGEKEYPAYARCEWLIDAGSANKTIYLEFETLSTECSYDFLFIYDGDSYLSPVLASLSGENIPDPVIARSGKMLVYLFSDRNYEQPGFEAHYSIQECPLNCSNHGHCVDNACLCITGYTGYACQTQLCPDDCGMNGTCINSTYCECDDGFSGYMCNITLNDAEGSELWYEIMPGGMGFSARSAHAGAFLSENNCLYIFGGFTLNVILNDLVRYCFDSNHWETLEVKEDWPSGRYEHAIVQFGFGFYMFGGIMGAGHYSNELWYFNATTETWILCAENSTVIPLNVSGHTLTVVEDDLLYLFGGKTEDGLFWSKMFVINATEPEEWSEILPKGGKASQRRLVGHSTVYHKESKSLLVYGGYSHTTDQPRFGTHSKDLHVFHIDNKIWSRIVFDESESTTIPYQRSFHSALIMGNYMVVYGGNTHVHHMIEMCYDYNIYLYHLGCHTWVKLEHLMRKYNDRNKVKLTGRVSHVAVAAFGNILLVAGGYSGYVRDDLVAFKFPQYVAPPTSEAGLDLDYCVNYTNVDLCVFNPDCFYCNNISTTNEKGCLHRSQDQLCRDKHNYYKEAKCPGICGRLTSCLECLSQGQGATLTDASPQRRTYIQPCNWCVKQAQCQQRSKPEHTCAAADRTESKIPGWWDGLSASLSQIDQCRLEDHPAGLQAVKYRHLEPEHTCATADRTESKIPGWWDGLSASLSQIDQCRLEDHPAGLQAVKYRPKINLNYPDEVEIIRETDMSEKFRHIYSKAGEDLVIWMGYIHPLNATVPPHSGIDTYTLNLVAEKISVVLRMSKGPSVITSNDTVATIILNNTAKEQKRDFDKRYDGSMLFANRSRGNKYFMYLEGKYQYPKYNPDIKQIYKVELDWNGISYNGNPGKIFHPFKFEFLEPFKNSTCSLHKNCLACMTDAMCGWCEPDDVCISRNSSTEALNCNPGKIFHPFTFEFLEPFKNSTCSLHKNCLACMTDAMCGWCEPDDVCISRNSSTEALNCTGPDREKLLITEPTKCPMCPDHVECKSCAEDSRCEWLKNVYCARRGRADKNEAVHDPAECPASCHERTNCSACLHVVECAWCENLRTCLPFSDYVSRHRHGQCTEWIDSEVANSDNPYTCRNCTSLTKPDRCLKTFSCGWCGNKVNPNIGICVEGDFAGPYGDLTCAEQVAQADSSVNATELAIWSYTTVPDVEECLLGIALCHPNATCINTPTSYNCSCNRGFMGDGREICERTCYHKCAHGECLVVDDEYMCDCDLGWTGVDCGTDCKCNGHSMCENGTGKCDFCLNGTTGPYCDRCMIGHYGNPTSPEGCFKCKCNNHGDESRGLCNNKTGECYCIDHATGHSCEKCEKGYYGNPRNGSKCYLGCDHGMVVEGIKSGSVGSFKGPGVSTWRAYCLWIFTVFSNIDEARMINYKPSITFGVEDLDVECERDHVYIYDGIPKFVDSEGNGVLIGSYCGTYLGQFKPVIATSGIVTVYFDADISQNVSSTRGFNGSYFVNKCTDDCDYLRNQFCYKDQCICKYGYTGFPECTQKHCDKDCVYLKESDSCLCQSDFGGAPFQITKYPWDANAIPMDFHGHGPVSRYGHALIHCDDDDDIMYLFGGMSLKFGLLNDIWQYSFKTHLWTGIKPLTNDQPSPRYFHAGACVPLMKRLYIFGGLVKSYDSKIEYTASKEMWKFAIDAKKWTGPSEVGWVEGIAGHSMTRVDDTILVIIGGFSTTEYFSDTVYFYDANKYVSAWEVDKWDNLTGSKPTGIYGHSAVYNEPSETIYIYGGHIYRHEHLFVSDHLFTYDPKKKRWNVLQPEPHSKLEPRYFHSAVGFNEYMVVVGGYSHHREMSSDIMVYKYKCNYWFKLNLSDAAEGNALTRRVAAQAIKYNNSLYIHGGIGHYDHKDMYRLQLPADICRVHSTRTTCQQPGCNTYIVGTSAGENMTYCYGVDGVGKVPNELVNHPNRLLAEVKGDRCNQEWHRQRDCQKLVNCSECVATYPQFKHTEPACFWCTNCLIGRCVPQGYACDSLQCNVVQGNSSTSPPRLECPILSCAASTCGRCRGLGCVWTQFFKKFIYPRGEIGRSRSLFPEYDWSCVLKSIANQIESPHFTYTTKQCPAPCYSHKNCEACLTSKGAEGGSRECYWSETLHECLPPAYLPLHCLGGKCGTVLQGASDKCPVPCSTFTKCADCRRAQGCGWCAFGGENGHGRCMSGTRSGPSDNGHCDSKGESKTDTKSDTKNPEHNEGKPMTLPTDWAYGTCPAENECANSHHDCDEKTQDCEDLLDGFMCKCKVGYMKREDSDKNECKPVCHQECEHGRCVKPDVCECDFGYVGANCSTECECNGHSTCESVERKYLCLDCKNNTQGDHCEQCKPLYVGDPKKGGKCVSCREFCNNHSDICMYWTDYETNKRDVDFTIQNFHYTKSQAFIDAFSTIQRRGPVLQNMTICLNCQDHTNKRRCEECKVGYFRLQDMSLDKPCMKCMCNGHSDTCDSNSGINCLCQNNTESRCAADDKNKEDLKCHELQCAKCKEYFLGTPTKGHHCYRLMTVNKDYCFDPLTQAECTRNPTALLPGRTVFFAVQPKYVNVDIRVTIDVTVGGIDVYFSPEDDTFIVNVDKYTGNHSVKIDEISTGKYRGRRSITTSHNNGYLINEIQSKDVNTFITVEKPQTLLVIRDVRSRLVITLPHEKLDLKTSRFYIIFQSTGGGMPNKTFGSLYFRQDQPHIDLFVFFSVFFSCFFLFLAMCVLLWKTKQGFDARRTRQQRAKEMLHMASRPFAKVLVLIGHRHGTSATPKNNSPDIHGRIKKATDRTPLLPSEISRPLSAPIVIEDSLEIIPIAIEPTDDGVAAIGTVMFQLPGGSLAPSQLCLGSTLTKGYQLNVTGKSRRPLTSSNC